MIRKTYTPPQAQAQSSMDPEQQKLWDRWCDSRIRCAVDGIADAIGPLHRKLHEEIQKLRAEVASLRDLTENKTQDSPNVTRLRGTR
jgi:hypothetical protein